MRMSRRVTYSKKIDVKSVEIDDVEFHIVNISSIGVLLNIEDHRPRLKNDKDIPLTINLRNHKVYTETGKIVRSSVYEMAIEFNRRVPYSIFSDRENFRLVYSQYFNKPQAYISITEKRYRITEISHPNVIVIEKTDDFKEGDVISGMAHFVYNDRFTFEGNIYALYDDRVVIMLEKDISQIVVAEELGLYRNFPKMYSEMKVQKEKIASRIQTKKQDDKKGSIFKSLFKRSK